MSLVVRRYKTSGRGVYSTQPIRKGELVEVSPVVIIPGDEYKPMMNTILERYAFEWGADGEDRAIALGYGALFKHNPEPNLDFRLSPEKDAIEFRALRNIPAREQLSIDYGWSEDDERRWLER